MKFNNLKKKLFKYNYDNNSYDYSYDDLNNSFNNYNYSYQNNPSNEKKKKNKNKLWMTVAAFSSVVGVCLIGYAVYTITNTTVSQENPRENNSQNKSDFTISSPASYWISQRTLSLRFVFKSPKNSSSLLVQSGTGWIYQADKNSNTFYIATNLHVANIVSFNNKTVTTFENNQTSLYHQSSYQIQESYVGLDFNVNSQKNDFSNDIYYFQTDTPEIVYTTTDDTTFNNQFNSVDQKYYGLGENDKATPFPGAVDIAILKYVINPTVTTTVFSNYYQKEIVIEKSDYINKFKSWISNYFSNPTKIYTDYIDDIKKELLVSNLYMGGFPNKQDIDPNVESTKNISWLSFSNFKIVNNDSFPGFYSSSLFYTAEQYESNVPIAFYPKANETDYTKYNYLSIGYLSLIEADSYSGASGSPIVVQRNGEFEIIGIYWGSISYVDNYGKENTYGTMNWFATNSYEFYNRSIGNYNLTTEIDKKINGA